MILPGAALLIVPNCGFGETGWLTLASGPPKFTVLKALKNSARSCRLSLSDNLVSLIAERSHVKEPGWSRKPFPELPQVFAGATEKQVVSNHSWMVGLLSLPLQVRLGRAPPKNSVLVLLRPMAPIVKGKPVRTL